MVFFNGMGLAIFFAGGILGLGIVPALVGKTGNIEDPFGLLMVGIVTLALDLGVRLFRKGEQGWQRLIRPDLGGCLACLPLWVVGTVLSLGGLSRLGSAPAAPDRVILGRWEAPGGQQIMVFSADGTLREFVGHQAFSCKYRIIDDRAIELIYDQPQGPAARELVSIALSPDRLVLKRTTGPALHLRRSRSSTPAQGALGAHTCIHCGGERKAMCPGCLGGAVNQPLKVDGEEVFRIYCECKGTGWIPCPTCGATGWSAARQVDPAYRNRWQETCDNHGTSAAMISSQAEKSHYDATIRDYDRVLHNRAIDYEKPGSSEHDHR